MHELTRLEAAGAIKRVPDRGSHVSHVTRMFMVPKEGGKWRLVMDLRHLNSFCVERKCRFETLKVLRSILGWLSPMIGCFRVICMATMLLAFIKNVTHYFAFIIAGVARGRRNVCSFETISHAATLSHRTKNLELH